MQKTKVVFAYKAGFRRVWAVTALIWIVVVGFLSTRFANLDYANLSMLMFIPPAALYLIGVALVWIIEGFARADR
jgi:asparagine N-glycosylation enzyme membrane subunit Stt3